MENPNLEHTSSAKSAKLKKRGKQALFFLPLLILIALFMSGKINFNNEIIYYEDDQVYLEGDADAQQSEAEYLQDDEDDNELFIPVETSAPGSETLYALYSGTSSLYADNKTEVAAKVGGQITQLLVEEGDFVEQGQVLARIEPDRYRLEVERAQANLNKISQEITRKQDLYEQKLIPRDSFESLKYDKDSAKVALSIAKLDLNHTRIRAPISGVISSRKIQRGNVINLNQATFEITSLSPLQADLYIPERELSKIKVGQQAQVLFDALSDANIHAQVKRISPIIDSKTGTLKTTLEIDNTQNLLRPGMFGRFNVIFDQRDNAMTLPRTAIEELDDEKSIYHIVDGKAQRVVVATGYENKGRVEILSGLEGNEAVVILGQSGLRQGSKVKVVAGPETQSPEYKAQLIKKAERKAQQSGETEDEPEDTDKPEKVGD